MTNWHAGCVMVDSTGVLVELGLYEGDFDFAKQKMLSLLASTGIAAMNGGRLNVMMSCAQYATSLLDVDFSKTDFENGMVAAELIPGFLVVLSTDQFLNEDKVKGMFEAANEGVPDAKFEWNLTDHRECQKLDHCVHTTNK